MNVDENRCFATIIQIKQIDVLNGPFFRFLLVKKDGEKFIKLPFCVSALNML